MNVSAGQSKHVGATLPLTLRACESFAHVDLLGARSPEPLMGCDKSKEERLWRAALPADECFSGPSDQNIHKL